MKRTSFKDMSELAGYLGLRVIKLQRLGNAKDYWYEYSVVDKDNKRVLDPSPLKEVAKFLRSL